LRPSLGRREAQALALGGKFAYRKCMERIFGPAPDAGEIESLALAALARLPEQFRAHLGDVLLMVEEFAEDETLAELGIDDPFDLTGLYEGVPLGEKNIAESGAMPDRIRLFRAPILDEWIARGDETLEHLVAHVLIHEVGHHFGLSDADIAALEASV
jgi:predicted Zn-dependent protease with MMP-like domain